MKSLYIDFDGVILDTINTSYKMLEEAKIDPKDSKKTTAFYKKMDWKHILEITPVINDGISCIERIIESNLFDVSILTHVNSLEEAIEKVKYIRKYFKDITIIPVPKEISKTKMVHTKGSILVDDYSGNLTEWASEGGIPIRFSPTLDSKGFTVINKLDQIIDMEFAD
jgi:hypothetical protein